MLAVLGTTWSVGRKCEDLDVLYKAPLAKSRDRRSQMYFFRVPRARLSVAHDASTSVNGAILIFASDKRRAAVKGARLALPDACRAQQGADSG